jgi:hypothetical protein
MEVLTVLDNCYKCGNCNNEDVTYYCPYKDEIIVKEVTGIKEKIRDGWKKGTKGYEEHRRKTRSEVPEV